MIDTPLVDVIMPAYNAEKYIDKSIQSVISQEYRNLRLYVIDDCSTDNTVDIVKKWMQLDDRISLIPLQKNTGVANVRNIALDACKGEYIAFLDSDDVWYPNKLSLQVGLAERKKADIVYCSYDMIDDCKKKEYDPFIVPETIDFETMLIRSVMSCSTVMLRRSTAGKERFDDSYYHEDYVFWLSLLKNGMKAYGIVEPLAQYRIVSGSRSNNKLQSAIHRFHIYRAYLKLPFFKSVGYLIKYATAGVSKYYFKKANTDESK